MPHGAAPLDFVYFMGMKVAPYRVTRIFVSLAGFPQDGLERPSYAERAR